MIVNIDSLEIHELIDGFEARFVHAEKLTLIYWEIKAGLPFPLHQHTHEQTSFIIEGELEAEINGKIKKLKPGDFWVISPHTVHGGKALTDAKLVDVFYPIREDYKKLSGK